MEKSTKNSKEKFWEDHVHKFRQSGWSRRQYCKSEKLSYWTFRDWQKKIEKTADEKMVKIPWRVRPQKNDQQSSIEIVVGKKLTVRIAPGFDGELLRDLLCELGVRI